MTAIWALESWVTFLAGPGAIVLTSLAGAELDPRVLRAKWKEASAVDLVSFAAPFFGCAAVAYWGLGWLTPATAGWPASRCRRPQWRLFAR